MFGIRSNFNNFMGETIGETMDLFYWWGWVIRFGEEDGMILRLSCYF